MGNVGKGSAVDEGGVPFEGLGDVGQEGLAQEQGHCPSPTDVAGFDRVALGRGAHDDVAQTLAKVSVIVGQHKNGHHLACGRDVKTVLSDVPVGRTTHANDDGSQRTVVHVDDPRPGYSSWVQFSLVSVLDVVVNE